MDEDTDMLTYDDDVPVVHLEDLPVGTEVGTEKTYDIS